MMIRLLMTTFVALIIAMGGATAQTKIGVPFRVGPAIVGDKVVDGPDIDTMVTPRAFLQSGANGGIVEAPIMQMPNNSLMVEPPIMFNPRISVGATALSSFGEIIYLVAEDGQMFVPAGVPFTAQGTGELTHIALGAVGPLPASQQQTDTSETRTITSGESYSYNIIVAAGVDHIVTGTTVRTTTDTPMRVQIYRGTDASGLRAVDQVFEPNANIDTLFAYEAFPRFITGEELHVVLTATGGNVTMTGLTIGGVFNPYIIPQGHAYSLVTPASAEAIRDKLQTLTEADRLDASAIKNMPEGVSLPITADDVTIDDDDFTNVNADTAQLGFAEVDRLWALVENITPGDGRANRFGRPISPFTGNVVINAQGVFDDYDNELALYSRDDNRRVSFDLPPDTVINAQYPVEFLVLHQSGRDRIATGNAPVSERLIGPNTLNPENPNVGITRGPTNTIVIRPPTGETLRRNSDTGPLIAFGELHKYDFATIRKTGDDAPWVVNEVTLAQGALLVPEGIFTLRDDQPLTANGDRELLLGFDILQTPAKGDVYPIHDAVGSPILGANALSVGDAIIALVDDPSHILSADNSDWLYVENAENSQYTATARNFLHQIDATDTNVDSRLIGRDDVTAVRAWIANSTPLVNVPFINPSTDPDNTETNGIRNYYGGDEQSGPTYEFRLPGVNIRDALLYIDIDGTFLDNGGTEANAEDVYVIIEGADGVEISAFNLADDFRAETLVGSSDTYYTLDITGNVGEHSSIHYIGRDISQPMSISVVFRRTVPHYLFTQDVNVVNSIPDAGIDISKLDRTTQALIRTDHTLSSDDRAKLAGLNISEVTTETAIPLHEAYYWKDDDNAAATNVLENYYPNSQASGLIPYFERARPIFLLIPLDIAFDGIERQDNPNIKLPVSNSPTADVTTHVVSAGVITTLASDGSQTQWNAYRTVIPAANADPFSRVWQLDGVIVTTSLTGFAPTAKVERVNLADSVVVWVNSLLGGTPSSFDLPDVLQRFTRHLSVTTDASSEWLDIDPSPIRAKLTRQFAALWDENRRTFTGNYFTDITGVELSGFSDQAIFYYSDPNDPYNQSFPGAQSYLLSDNVRIHNTTGDAPITPSFRKVIAFDYALQSSLGPDDDVNIIRVGAAASTALLGLSEAEGLYLNVGLEDGTTRSRTIATGLPVVGGHWHSLIDEVVNAEAEIELPQTLSGSLAVTVNIRLDNNGVDAGTHSETFTINNVDTDQTIGLRDFSYVGFADREVSISYDHDNDDEVGNERRIITLVATQPLNNAALTYDILASYPRAETWTLPATYRRVTVNAGSGHNDFDLYDPHLYDTEQVLERNRILLSFQKWEENDNDPDPELAVRMVVDGQLEGQADVEDFLIRLHRPASDFTFNNINFNNGLTAVTHLQVYDYDGIPPSSLEVQRLYTQGNAWLGAFWEPGHAIDDVVIDANIEVSAGHGIIVTDKTTGTRKLISVDNNNIDISDAIGN